MNRAKHVKSEIEFAEKEHRTSIVIDMLKENKLPLRVTHNDTKFNNVLIVMRLEKVYVLLIWIPLCPEVLFDFGDSIRSGANTADEDEQDLSRYGWTLTCLNNLLEAT